jgi:hypothetical protein
MLRTFSISIALLLMLFGIPPGHASDKHASSPAFQTSDRCVACHNGMRTRSGEDWSIGVDWRSSIMANSSRDPYWQGSVRRETLDHSSASSEIQDECSHCHMPMGYYEAYRRLHPARSLSHSRFWCLRNLPYFVHKCAWL